MTNVLSDPGRGSVVQRFAVAVEEAPLLACLSTILATMVLFSVWPQLDVAVSRLLHDPVAGFWMKDVAALKHVRHIGSYLPVIVGVAGAIVVILAFFMPDREPLFPVRVAAFLAAVQVVGPGLVVNGILKPVYGRPRPHESDVFGGEFPFVPPFERTDVCDGGCASFVSGEAAGAASLLCLVLLAPAIWRGPALVVFSVFMVLVSFARMAFGAHYLSDVLAAWGVTFIVVILLRRLMVPAAGGADDAIGRSVLLAGSATRALAARRLQRPTRVRSLVRRPNGP